MIGIIGNGVVGSSLAEAYRHFKISDPLFYKSLLNLMNLYASCQKKRLKPTGNNIFMGLRWIYYVS